MRTLTTREWASFWQRVRVAGPGDCWEWQGAQNDGGYGRFRIDGSLRAAHRIAYAVMTGYLDDNTLVRHRCDNRLCCNPGHLDGGDAQDNANDMVERGRAAFGMRNGRTKLTVADVMMIRINPDGLTGKQLAERFGVAQSTITYIRQGRSWRFSPRGVVGGTGIEPVTSTV